MALSALLVAATTSVANEHDSHIRISDHGLKALVELGSLRSETFRAVAPTQGLEPRQIAGYLSWSRSTRGTRGARSGYDRWPVTRCRAPVHT